MVILATKNVSDFCPEKYVPILLPLLISATVCLLVQEKQATQRKLDIVNNFSVNKAAGKKIKPASQTEEEVSDVMTNMASNKGTLSNAITQANEEYAAISTSDLCLTIGRTKPTKPSVDSTTSTPFEIIEIKGKVHKCAGCRGQLKDGPDPYLKTDLDEICVYVIKNTIMSGSKPRTTGRQHLKRSISMSIATALLGEIQASTSKVYK